MSLNAKPFHLGDLLSITDGRLLSPNHIDGVAALLSHMTGDLLMTHQLPLASDAMEPELLQQHPWLGDVQAPPQGTDVPDLLAWLDWAAGRYGERHEVAPAPWAWGSHDPIQDFRNQRPDAPVIAVELPGEPT